jgi:SpoVK/Ycf46/Vps4 family AAA+-type ATPase
MKSSEFKSFNYLENGEVLFSIFETKKSTKKLDSGFYDVWYESYPKSSIIIKQLNIEEEIKIHEFPDKEKLDTLFKSFFDEKVLNSITRLGFLHKTGVLLYGKEGTGKSTIFKHYANKAVINNNAIVFYVRREFINTCWSFIQDIRSIQDNPIVVIFEEVERHIKWESNEGVIKTILDGNLSINNCVFLASTNYIDEIPSAIKNRPSRFKYVLDIEGIQDESEVERILTTMIGDMFTAEEIKLFANDLKGHTLDNIKQFAMDKLMDLKTYKKENKKIGFIR